MESSSQRKRIVVIDRQKHWRKLSVQALTEAGFSVHAVDSYEYPPPNSHFQNGTPDLVVLGCARIGMEEQAFISRILEQKQPLLVLSTALSWKVMRALFLVGASDVEDKPYDPGRLIEVVQEALASTASRDNYKAVEQGGVS